MKTFAPVFFWATYAISFTWAFLFGNVMRFGSLPLYDALVMQTSAEAQFLIIPSILIVILIPATVAGLIGKMIKRS